jgi:hypothetical protein
VSIEIRADERKGAAHTEKWESLSGDKQSWEDSGIPDELWDEKDEENKAVNESDGAENHG